MISSALFSPLLLLQQVDTVQSVTQPAAAESMSLLDILIRGGWVMLPLALLSLLTIALFVERLLRLQRAQTNPKQLTSKIRGYVQAGEIESAIAHCSADQSPIGRILQHGLERLGRPISEIQEAVQSAGKHEAFELEKRTGMLASIAGVAPMLGFLGTVTGMIQAFQQIQNLQGNVNPSVLAEGIWEALITTAFGLAVGILAFLAYNFLLNRINRIVNDMERSATDFVDLLQEPVPSDEISRY